MSDEQQTARSSACTPTSTHPAPLFARFSRVVGLITNRLSVVGLAIHRGWTASMRWILVRSLQAFERLFLQSHTTRYSTRTVVRGSARGAGSVGKDASKTAAGASRNLDEIMGIVDRALSRGMDEGAWSAIVDGLETVTQACSNGKPPQNTPEYTFSKEELDLVLLAADCAKVAYHNSLNPTQASLLMLDAVEQVTTAARDGSIKACILVSHAGLNDSVVVVAFRGTASLVDWLVNLDGDLEDAASFINAHSTSETAAAVAAHAGLLRVAKAMAEIVCDKIMSTATASPAADQQPILLLTGHSAGGGVAGLMSAHIRAQRRDIQSRFKTMHCVTFAAPPVLSSPSVAGASSMSSGLSLNIVNFGDIVPRASKSYIRSLLALYNERAEHVVDREWEFGEPDAWNYGSNVLLVDVSDPDAQDDNYTLPAEAGGSADVEDDEPDIRAFGVSSDVWKRLAFGSVKTHPMDVYLESITALRPKEDDPLGTATSSSQTEC